MLASITSSSYWAADAFDWLGAHCGIVSERDWSLGRPVVRVYGTRGLADTACNAQAANGIKAVIFCRSYHDEPESNELELPLS